MFQPMHILSKSQPFLSKTFDTETFKHFLIVSVQPLERWRSHIVDDADDATVELECFVMSEPMQVEITTLAKLEGRGSVFRWSRSASDVEGCFLLSSPTVLKHSIALEDAHVPIISLMDRLDVDYASKLEVVRHTRGAESITMLGLCFQVDVISNAFCVVAICLGMGPDLLGQANPKHSTNCC